MNDMAKGARKEIRRRGKNDTTGGAEIGLLNQETRKAEAKHLHGFMDSLSKPIIELLTRLIILVSCNHTSL
jgi:hypothetical protein